MSGPVHLESLLTIILMQVVVFVILFIMNGLLSAGADWLVMGW